MKQAFGLQAWLTVRSNSLSLKYHKFTSPGCTDRGRDAISFAHKCPIERTFALKSTNQ